MISTTGGSLQWEVGEAFPFIFGTRRRTLHPTQNISQHREETWNTANWERTVRRFPHWDLVAWECLTLMDQRMKRNHSRFFGDIWNSAAIFLIRPKSTVRTRTRNWLDVFCARFLAIT